MSEQTERIYRWKRCDYYTPHLQTMKEYIGCLYRLEGCCSGGLLHILLDDDNIDDDSVLYCLTECIKHPEREESKIGKLICEEYLQLSMQERRLLLRSYIMSFDCCCQETGCEGCFINTGEGEY